jgi:hypothetical protein
MGGYHDRLVDRSVRPPSLKPVVRQDPDLILKYKLVTDCFDNFMSSVGLTLTKFLVLCVSIPINFL